MVAIVAPIILLLLRTSTVAAGPRVRKKSRQHSRVRKEIRQLSQRQLALYIRGLTTMLTVDTATGQRLYGPYYKEWDYFVNKHAVTVYDSRGDQGHFGPSLVTFHRIFIYEYELALLSVVPELEAAPYWNFLLDLSDGKYYQTTKWIFSPNYAGIQPGDPSYNYTVTDGFLAWRNVSKYNHTKFGATSAYYSGSKTTGLMRSSENTNSNPYVTRYPRANLQYATFMNVTNLFKFLPRDVRAYTRAYAASVDPTLFPTWDAWTSQIDKSGFHPSAHWLHGSVSTEDPTYNWGDFYDMANSPNEPILFIGHHANLDRNNLIWMSNAVKANPSYASPNVMWQYPKEPGYDTVNKIPINHGCTLHDVVNELVGFTGELFKNHPPANPLGYTHFEVLQYTKPGKTPYTYDDMRIVVPGGK